MDIIFLCSMRKSLYHILLILFSFLSSFRVLPLCAQSVCDFPDIQVFASNNPQSEVHISVNPTDSNNLILSCNTYPGHYSQGYFYSTDGGNTWNGSENLQGYTNLGGDPSTAFDANGNGYISTLNYTQLRTATAILMQESNDNGINWGNISDPINNDPGTDKDMIASDNVSTSPFHNNIYCGWTYFDANGTMHIMIDHLANGGQTFIDDTEFNGNGQGVNLQTAPNGNVYAAWAYFGSNTSPQYPATGLGFSLSTNGGQNFSPPVVAFNYTGIDIDKTSPDPTFNNIGINDFPSMAVDKSAAHPGRIYVVYPEEVNGKAVIGLRYSDNEGTNWSAPIIVSESSFQQSFFPWISVDPTNGDIYIIYYAFDQPSGFSTDAYIAYSNNGAASFQNLQVSDVPFTTQPINNNLFRTGYMGDYIGIAAYGGKAWATWMDDRNGTWQIYVSQVVTSGEQGEPAPVLYAGNNFDWYCNSSTQSFYTPSYHNAVSYTWSTTGGLTIDGNPSPYTTPDTSVTISGSTNQYGNISVVANLSCGAKTIPSAPQLFVEQPDFTPTFVVNCPPSSPQKDQTDSAKVNPDVEEGPLYVYFYNAPANLRISQYHWYVDGSSNPVTTNTNNLPNPTTGTHTISVSINTQCGWTLPSDPQQVTLCNTCCTSISMNAQKKSLIVSKDNFVIYPNPVITSSVNIESKEGVPLGIISLYNPMGKLILSKRTGNSFIDLTLPHLPPGVYLLKIINYTHRPFVKKVLIDQEGNIK